MSHRVLIRAFEFIAAVDYYHTVRERRYQIHSRTYRIFTVLTAQRQLFNTLAPLLPSKDWMLPLSSSTEKLFRLLIRADTFRFATSLHVCCAMTTALAQELLSKMDCVIKVEVSSNQVDDNLTVTLLALPHLERAILRLLRNPNMTYNGTVRPLLNHPRESVRRSVAVAVSTNWFRGMSTEELIAAYRDDVIPLIDSASCNGAIPDYLALADASSVSWNELSPDIIVMLGDRLFQFFTAANSHSRLVELSLKLLCKLATASIRQNTSDPAVFHLVVDVFKEWPVLEWMPDRMRSGLVMPHDNGVDSLIRAMFDVAPPKVMMHHRVRFFELQLADVIYDLHLAATGNSPFADFVLWSIFACVAYTDPVSFLTKTNVMQKELQQFLVPWHREVMAKVVVLQRRGERVVDERWFFVNVDYNDFVQRTDSARLLLQYVIDQPSERRPDQVLRLLFDESEGLNIGPILRSFVMASLDHRSRQSVLVANMIYDCQYAAEQERSHRIESRRRPRDAKHEAGADNLRYLSEFLDSLDWRQFKFG